jgi:hypothetical protein
MFRTILGHRRRGMVVPVLAAALAVPTTLALSGAFAGTTPSAAKTALLRQQAAQRLLKSPGARYMTWPAQVALHYQATGDRAFSQQLLAGSTAQAVLGEAQPAGPAGPAGPAVPSADLRNVRVNNPGEDTHQVDQTTQSETSIAVSGSRVAVAYNDSQVTGLAMTAGSDLNGYSYSTNGGRTFTDGGALPNAAEFMNLGDPWLASARNGTMYYSTLAMDFFNGNLDVAVAKSTNGGKSWSAPVPVFRPPGTTFYNGDKDAMAIGRDPAVASRDDIYVSYDDFSVNSLTNASFNGLPVAHSTDGGKHWTLKYATKFNAPKTGCSSVQYIGATPLVTANGTLYVFAERIAVNDPKCRGTATTFSEVFFKSTNGGNKFSPGVKIANVTPAEPDGLLHLGPGRYARTIEFPSPAVRGNKIYVAWNDGTSGSSHIRLATSANGGRTWAATSVTGGSGDDVQPALSASASGLNLLYYHRNPNNTLDVRLGTWATGTSWTTRRVNSVSFRGVLTVPQFDPIIAAGYMGDYIANLSAGSHLYFAWGDNRDRVRDFMFPRGRNDPDVFFARK